MCLFLSFTQNPRTPGRQGREVRAEVPRLGPRGRLGWAGDSDPAPAPGTRLRERPLLGMSRVLGGSRTGQEMLLLARETHLRSQSRQRRSRRAGRAKRGGAWGRARDEPPRLCALSASGAGAAQGTRQTSGADRVSAGCASVCPRCTRVRAGAGDARRWWRRVSVSSRECDTSGVGLL